VGAAYGLVAKVMVAAAEQHEDIAPAYWEAVAQVQFRAVLDALNEHVSRLGELPGSAKPPRSG
jgi:hypothetical protein